MFERKRKVTLSKEEVRTPLSSSMMAIRRKNNNEIVDKTNLSDSRGPRKNKKNPWPKNETGSLLSWDGNSRATSSSWPEDIEEAATRKVLNLWYAIERTLYEEDAQVPLGNIMDECIQWKTQIPHFRVVGTKKRLEIAENDSETGWSGEHKSHCSTDRQVGNNNADNNSEQKKSDSTTKNEQHIIEEKERVIDLILEYIYAELEKDEEDIDNDADIESSSKNLDEVLTITPAPTYSGRKNIKSKKIIKSNSRMSSANINESFQVTERRININALKKSRKNAKNAADNYSTIDIKDEDDSEIDESLQHARNKPGTIFNEKVVVSPVPYAVTTRASFCTLKTTPIRYAGHLLELTTPHELNRTMNSASKVNSAHKISYLRIPERHSAWQSSIYPIAWPKNVRLAPIDPSRLPSSKKRSSTVSPSIPQRNRNSLSPISRPLRTTTAAFASDTVINDDDILKINGKQIVTCSVRPNLLKTGLNQRSSINSDRGKKIKSKSDR